MMMRERINIFSNIDWLTIFLYLTLVLLGWLNIYAAEYDASHKSIFDISQNYGRQMIWIATSLVLAIMILMTIPKFFSAFSYLIYGIIVFLLIAVLFIGSEASGSKSWIQIGSFKIQPSEFAKFATNLAIARYLSSWNFKLKKVSAWLKLAVLLGMPMGLILLQNDTGSALVFLSFILVFYREGMSGRILLAGSVFVLLFVLALLLDQFILIGILSGFSFILFWFLRRNKKEILRLIGLLILAVGLVLSVDYVYSRALEPHQKSRIDVLLGKETDLKGAGYNVNQSKIAIGSGGLFGKGFLKGTQTKFNFVPEQSTDFIFCTIGEEWGFLGSFVIIALFIALLLRIIIIAECQRSPFSRIYAYGVAAILFFHFAINIGMTLGLAPVIGIPLPFISYGGSSLWAFTILLFILIRLDTHRLRLV